MRWDNSKTEQKNWACKCEQGQKLPAQFTINLFILNTLQSYVKQKTGCSLMHYARPPAWSNRVAEYIIGGERSPFKRVLNAYSDSCFFYDSKTLHRNFMNTS
jgi:hypothetical protein